MPGFWRIPTLNWGVSKGVNPRTSNALASSNRFALSDFIFSLNSEVTSLILPRRRGHFKLTPSQPNHSHFSFLQEREVGLAHVLTLDMPARG